MTVYARQARDTGARRRPVPWPQMLWVTWRQHRGILISVAVATVAAVVVMLVLGQKVHQDAATLQACQPTPSPACPGPGNFFTGKFWQLTQIVHVAVPALPVLLAMFAGPPVLARELENSTFRYAWTQGIGRVRWAVLKFTILGSVVTIAALLISQLFAWFFDPFLKAQHMTAISWSVFDATGLSYAAWTLTAFCLGAFLGLLVRRVLPAMAVTVGLYVALAVLTSFYLRDHYPVSTYWPMQLFEAGWLLALSAALIAATVRLLRNHAS
jgi:hypothetical protein